MIKRWSLGNGAVWDLKVGDKVTIKPSRRARRATKVRKKRYFVERDGVLDWSPRTQLTQNEFVKAIADAEARGREKGIAQQEKAT